MPSTTPDETATLNPLRAHYRRMRDAGRFGFGRAWDAAVDAKLTASGIEPGDATPVDWVRAAEATTMGCGRCHGTGTYCWGGTVNGKPVHTGTCHHCGGAGTQTIDDMFRNRAYVRHSINRAI